MMFAVGVILAPAAHAGWYMAFFVGLNDVDDTTIATDLGTLDTSYDSGVAWGIAGGYEFERFRVEGEILSERENDVDVHRLDGVELQGSVGTLENEVGIANILYDFRREARVSPYIGVGVGVAEVTLSDYGFDGLPDVFAEAIVLAYQAIVGLGIELSPHWALQFDARYYATEDAELDFQDTTTEVSYSAINVTAGFRYSF
jgi:opacity protein-like surface antigen